MSSCSYNPVPSRVWSRVQNPCTYINPNLPEQYNVYIPLIGETVSSARAIEYDKQMYKGNVLQYKGNSAQLTKSQKYSQLARCAGPNRRKVFATQSETYTNPNNTGLLRVGFQTYPYPNQIVGAPNNISGPFEYNVSNPNDCSGNAVQDGGILVCGTFANPCSGEIYIRPNTNSTICNPASASNVPGPSILCWNKKLQTWFPKPRYVMNNSTDKWPINYKGFVSALQPSTIHIKIKFKYILRNLVKNIDLNNQNIVDLNNEYITDLNDEYIADLNDVAINNKDITNNKTINPYDVYIDINYTSIVKIDGFHILVNDILNQTIRDKYKIQINNIFPSSNINILPIIDNPENNKHISFIYTIENTVNGKKFTSNNGKFTFEHVEYISDIKRDFTIIQSGITDINTKLQNIENVVSIILDKVSKCCNCCNDCSCNDTNCDCELYNKLFESNSITKINEYISLFISTINTYTNDYIPIDVYDTLNMGLLSLEELFNNNTDCCFYNIISIYKNMLLVVKNSFDNKNLTESTLLNSEAWKNDSIILRDTTKLQEYIDELKKQMYVASVNVQSEYAHLKPQYNIYIQLYGLPDNLLFDPNKLSNIISVITDYNLTYGVPKDNNYNLDVIKNFIR